MKRYLNIFAKVIWGLLLVVIATTAVAFYAVQLPSVQTYLTEKATEMLSEKLGAPVSIKRVNIHWIDEATLEDVSIRDLKSRDMIIVKEVYVNCKTNFKFNRKNFLSFDNNIDYVMLRNPRVKLIREADGDFNINKWLDRIEQLTASTDTLNRPKGEHNIPFTIDEAYVQDGTFILQDAYEARMPKNEFDYYNFTINDIKGNLKNFFLQGDTIKFNLKGVNGIERRSDLVIKELNTNFFYSRQQLHLDNLFARVNNSTLRNSVSFHYQAPKDFSHFNSRVRMIGNLDDCEIDAQDLGRFATDMYSYKEMYHLYGKFDGTVEDFNVDDFKLTFGKESFYQGRIAFKHLPDLEKAFMDFDLKPSKMTAEDVRQYVGEELYTKQVSKFGTVDFSGTFKGLYNDFTTNAKVQSSGLGEANGNITMKITPESANSTYFGDVTIEELELGKLVDENDYLQKISFSGKIKGQGLSIKDATLDLDGKVKHIWFNNYDFKNIWVDGRMGKSIFDGRVSVKDTNLNADVIGKVDFNPAQNHFKIEGIVNKANLLPLGYAKNDVKLHTEIDLDFRGNELDNWLGNAHFLNTFLNYDKHDLVIDSIFVNSSLAADGLRQFKLNSEFFTIDLDGKFVPSQAISDIRRIVQEYNLFFLGSEKDRTDYYAIRPNFKIFDKYDINYQVKLKESNPFFAYFAPDVFVSNGSVLQGDLKIRDNIMFSMEGTSDTLRLGKYDFYTCKLDLNTSKEANSPKILTAWTINSDNQKLYSLSPTEKLEINGSWNQGNVIDFDAAIHQKSSKNQAQVFGSLSFLPKGVDIVFNPKNTRLNLLDNTWTLAQNNLINILDNEICFQNITLSNQNQHISLSGMLSENTEKAALVDVQDFDLQTLKPITDVDIKGIVNGKLELRDVYNKPLITSNVYVDELIYKNILIGTVAGEALWDNINQKMNINTNINRINQEIFRMTGTYNPSDAENPLDLKANLKRTNLEIFESFVNDIFSDLGGYATGTLSIKGKFTNPIIRGAVNFDRGALRLIALNSFVYFDDKILFNEEGFVTAKNGFTVKDAPKNGNEATLEGGIFNGGNNNFMLGIHAYIKDRDGFKIMNTTIKDNEDFYGTAYASGDLHITGDFKNVLITGNLTSKRGTKVTIPLDGATTVDTKEDGIPFVLRKTNEIVSENHNIKKDSAVLKKSVDLSGLRMAFNFTITPDAECEIIFDRVNQDQLNAFGNGQISIDYDTRGGFSMNGPYVVKNGKYNFSFQNLASLRKFDITEGSKLSWTGDPYDADIDVKASYTANILLNEIPGLKSTTTTASNTTTNAELSNRYPVDVVLNLRDKLMKPTITYGINFNLRQIPLTFQTYVLAYEQRMKDDQQLLSNNVSTILLMNQLFPTDNFIAAFNTQLVLDNIGGLLNNKIGDLASKLDPNFELGFQLGDIKQNMLNNMQLNFSYKFMNNRIRVSGNSKVLNNAYSQDQSQLTFGGEIEYVLSEDGAWRLKAYSKSVPNWSYGIFTDRNVLIYGANIQFTRNFNHIFNKPNSTTRFPLGIGSKSSPMLELSLKEKAIQ